MDEKSNVVNQLTRSHLTRIVTLDAGEIAALLLMPPKLILNDGNRMFVTHHAVTQDRVQSGRNGQLPSRTVVTDSKLECPGGSNPLTITVTTHITFENQTRNK